MISPYIFTVGMNLFVLLGKPLYRRWFLDGTDRDVRLVGLGVSSLFNVGGEAGWGTEVWLFMSYPYFQISKDFIRQRLLILALLNS